ncbi:helix-turn-helix domain-containing protein [Pseudomonas sp. ERGC3:01]|nr:helix-turn-helix domain-containing protein [Pseudomonas sp. ERGC3:01]
MTASIIAEAREKQGLNQSELARMLGVTPQAVQAWESGRSLPRPKKLVEIARALKIPSHRLLTASGLLAGPYLEVLKTLGWTPTLTKQPCKAKFRFGTMKAHWNRMRFSSRY